MVGKPKWCRQSRSFRVAILVALTTLVMSLLVAVSGNRTPAEAFGGEDLLSGSPWYHPAFTFAAASDQGFSEGAAASLAWHADYIDSYAYNPLFQLEPLIVEAVKGDAGAMDFLGFTDRKLEVNDAADDCDGLDCFNRYTASLAIHPDLVKLHFDDLAATDQYGGDVDATWYRLFGGTIAGLLWAAEHEDVAAAHNVLGVSLHAVQDFYSHSSWVDEPERRGATWLDLEPAERIGETVRTGSYEKPLDLYPHGKPSLTCSGLYGTDVIRGLLAGVDCEGDPDCLVALGTGSAFLGALQDALDIVEMICDWCPFVSQSSLCLAIDDCEGAEQGEMTVFGQTVPVYYHPAGVALDSLGGSQMGARERGLVDDTGSWVPGKDGNVLAGAACDTTLSDLWGEYDSYAELVAGPQDDIAADAPGCNGHSEELFVTAADLAERTSRQWLELIERVIVNDASLGSFWNRIMTESSLGNGNTRQYEAYDAFPFQFVTATAQSVDPETGVCTPGPSPRCPVLPGGAFDETTDDQYYLRVTLRTDDELFSGTDADIYLDVGGRSFLLDYTPTTGVNLSLVTAHNDFEAGDVETFMVGPFETLPDSITLRNDVPDFGDYIDAVLHQIETAVLDFISWLLRGLGLNGPDYVGSTLGSVNPDELATLAVGGEPLEKTFMVEGGSEGRYRLYFDIYKKAVAPEVGESTYGVEMRGFKVVKESTYDMGTNSDEPFMFVLLQGDQSKYLGKGRWAAQGWGWYPDADTGEYYGGAQWGFPYVFPELVTVTDETPLELSLQIWESDEESSSHRRDLFYEFLNISQPEIPDIIELIAMGIGADWKVEGVTVEAFSRSSTTVRYGAVYESPAGPGWINGGSSATIALSGEGGLTEIDITGDFVSPPLCEGEFITNTGWTEGADLIVGTTGDDVLYGGGGNDTIQGKGGNDTICGGPGNDKLNGGGGDDVIAGGPGKDTVVYFGASAGVTVDLGTRTGGGADQGNDTISGVEHVMGSLFGDVLRGNAAGNRLKGLTGADRLVGLGGADTLIGAGNNDLMYGGGGNDVLRGKAGADRLFGGPGDDTLEGNIGNDRLYGGDGVDVLNGGAGNADACYDGETYVSCELPL